MFRSNGFKLKCLLQTSSFSMLIDRFKFCRSPVDYCDVYKKYLYTTANVGPMICPLLNFLPDCKVDQRFHGSIFNIVLFLSCWRNLFCFAYFVIIPPKLFCTLLKVSLQYFHRPFYNLMMYSCCFWHLLLNSTKALSLLKWYWLMHFQIEILCLFFGLRDGNSIQLPVKTDWQKGF